MPRETRPKKIVYLLSTLKSCGPISQLRYILEHLDREYFEPLVVTLSPEPNDSAWLEIAAINVQIKSLNLSRIGGVVRGGSLYKRVLERFAPDLVHTQGIRPDILSAKSAGRAIAVATLRNYPYHDYPMKYGRVRGHLMAWRHLRALLAMRAVVACSNSVAEKLGCLEHNLHVIQNGVDIDRFNPASAQDFQAMRRKWGVAAGERVFVAAGALIPRKDPLMIIRSFSSSAALRRDHLLILGDGPLRAACEREAAGHGRIRIMGQVSDVRPYLQGADFFLSASHSEGLPNAVLEALACGLPTAVSDIPSHRELIRLSPEAGELFPVGDERAIRNSIEQLLNTDRRARSSAARALVRNHFSARKMSLFYQAMYSKLLDGKYVG